LPAGLAQHRPEPGLRQLCRRGRVRCYGEHCPRLAGTQADAANPEGGQRGREVLLEVRAKLAGQLPAAPRRILLGTGEHGDRLGQLGVCRQRPVRGGVGAQDVRQRHRVRVV